MPEEEIKPEPQPEQPKPEEKFIFPSLENGPSVCYENERHEIWIGLPLSKIGNPFYLLSSIDGSKTAALRYLDLYVQQIAARKKFEVSPQGKHINGVMKDMFEKGKLLVGLGKA